MDIRPGDRLRMNSVSGLLMSAFKSADPLPRKGWVSAVILPAICYSTAMGFLIGGAIGMILMPADARITRMFDGIYCGGLIGAFLFFNLAWWVTTFLAVVRHWINR
jgi:hypothetical protein